MSRKRTARSPASRPGPGPVATIELEDLFVDPDYSRRGIAAALVTASPENCGRWAHERLEVTANPHALEFYRAAGFTDCGVAETDFGDRAPDGTGTCSGTLLTAGQAGDAYPGQSAASAIGRSRPGRQAR